MRVQRIELPVNLRNGDTGYFSKCQTWEYKDPALITQNFVVVYPKGYCTDVCFTPVRNIQPWEGFYRGFNKTYFLGELSKGLWKRRLKLKMGGNLYYCINEFSDNYFHWFTEVLPKMLFVIGKDAAAVFFIPFTLRPYQIHSLKACGIRVVTTDRQIVLFRKITVVENVAIYPGIYHPALLNLVRECIRRAGKLQGYPKKQNRRIYVTRKSADRRRLMNETEILPVLLELKFEVFDFDHVPFPEQLAIITGTDILLSIHGAALTNMLFLPEKAAVIEMLPVDVPNDKCYYILAGTLQLTYYYVDCRLHGQNHVTGELSVDKHALRSLLQDIIRQQITV